MKILVLTPYYSPHVGGLESHAEQFNAHMAARGHTITVWTSRIPSRAPSSQYTKDGTNIYRYEALEVVPGFPIPAFWKLLFWHQWKKIKQQGPYSHVISRTRFFPSSIIAHVIAIRLRIPHIHIEHGSNFVKQNNIFINGLAYLYDMTLGTFVLRKANTVIANSKATALFVLQLTHGKVHATVIYRGIEHTKIIAVQSALQERLNTTGAIIITYIGRLISGKGVHDLLTSIAKCQTRSSIICWVIGDGPERVRLIAQAQALGIENKVRFFGTCDPSRVISIIKVSDIVVNPSYTEGLPTSIIEAALCGKAIIATNVGGTSEIVTNTVSAILLRPKDVPALASAIDTFVQNPDMRIAFGKAAQKEVTSKFLWEHAITQYEQILLYPPN